MIDKSGDLSEKKERAREIEKRVFSHHLAAFSDSSKETSVVLLALWVLLSLFQVSSPLSLLSIFSAGWVLWKGGCLALASWAKLEKWHLLIEQERRNIEQNLPGEKKKLRDIYARKGLSALLLDQVVETLSTDNSRLFQLVLEEKHGFSLEMYEHPLKQAFSATYGALLTSIAALAGGMIGGTWGIASALSLLFIASTWIFSKKEGTAPIKALVWHLAVATLVIGTLYFLSKLRGLF